MALGRSTARAAPRLLQQQQWRRRSRRRHRRSRAPRPPEARVAPTAPTPLHVSLHASCCLQPPTSPWGLLLRGVVSLLMAGPVGSGWSAQRNHQRRWMHIAMTQHFARAAP